VRICQRRGFHGLVGWHGYSEPCMDIYRILYLMSRITSDCVLWTNGSLLTEATRDWLPRFKRVSISLYTPTEAIRIRELVRGLPNCYPEEVRPDRRIDMYNTHTIDVGSCYRPSRIELPVNCYGYVVMCCADYNVTMRGLNIMDDDMDAAINTHELYARECELGNIPLCHKCRSIHSPQVRT
jgi:hypothetical protein